MLCGASEDNGRGRAGGAVHGPHRNPGLCSSAPPETCRPRRAGLAAGLQESPPPVPARRPLPAEPGAEPGTRRRCGAVRPGPDGCRGPGRLRAPPGAAPTQRGLPRLAPQPAPQPREHRDGRGSRGSWGSIPQTTQLQPIPGSGTPPLLAGSPASPRRAAPGPRSRCKTPGCKSPRFNQRPQGPEMVVSTRRGPTERVARLWGTCQAWGERL